MQGPVVVQRVDNFIQWINPYPVGLVRQLDEACHSGNLDGFLSVIYYYPDEARNIIITGMSGECGGTVDETPREFLHISSQHGHLDIVQQLIEFGADINQLSSELQTPLSMACMNGHLDVAKLLVSKGAKIDPSDSNFELSPVYLACCEGHADIVEFLISKDPIMLRKSGQLLLYTVAMEGHLDIVKLLIQRRININPPPVPAEVDGVPVLIDPVGAPLYGACLGQHITTAQYLIENGALVTKKIVETFWEVIGDVLLRYTKDATIKRKTTLSFETDPEISIMAAAWSSKNLCLLHKAWFINLSARLVIINLADNNLEVLPEELLNTLPVLQELDLSRNNLICLPEIDSSFIRLEKLFAQRNNLNFVPSSLFQIKSLKKVNLSFNKLSSLGEDPDSSDGSEDEMWRCTSLKVLKLSHNSLPSLPSGIQGTSGLVKLFVNNNELKSFPMPWKCPLETLDLSHNQLKTFTCNVEMVWASTMRYINLSNNRLEYVSWNICQLSSLQDLDLSHNNIKSLPMERYWSCTNLHKLNFSFNKLSAKMQGDPGSSTLRQRLFKTPSQDDGQEVRTDVEFPISLFGPTLETLLLNDNFLQVVPLSVCKLTALSELDLSNNTDLKTLPPQLGNLRNCWQLRLNKLNLIGLPKHVRPGAVGVRSKDTLAFLRATLRKSVPYYRIKLMVVGIQGYGKTTLLAALKGQPLPTNISTVGIVVDEWQVQVSASSFFSLPRIISQSGPPTITFSTWDLAGQSVYYAAHQMFLSPSTLYLAVWNATLGEEGIENLRRWLLNIKARAPCSDVLIVGTHLDRLPKKNRQSRLDKLKQIIMSKFADNKGFPKIVGNVVVSATTGENINELRELVYNKALKAKEHGEAIVGKQVPLSYIQLQDAVLQEADRRRTTGEPPVLLEEEILALANNNKDNDILDQEELALATRFLHENGVLLHYNDQLRGLNNLYFIDPSWVCDLIANIVTVRERNPFIKDGIMWRSNVALVLKDPRFPPQLIPQYLQLMERFEIALALDEHKLLIPSMLPPESPGMQLHNLGLVKKNRSSSEPRSFADATHSATGLNSKARTTTFATNEAGGSSETDNQSETSQKYKLDFEDETSDVVRRNYQMAYIPSGFWSRLITRLMVSVHRWRMTEGIEEDRFSTIYWRKGIGVMYEGGHFLVKSYREVVPLYSSRSRYEELEGISVEVWSAVRDFSVMGFIVDQIDALISEWYPGLDDTDNFGYPLVRRLIPCPRCTSSISRHNSFLRRSCSMEYPSAQLGNQPLRPYNFTLPTCAAAALTFATISCPYHPDSVVSLDELIPDLLMTDLPRHLFVDKNEFSYRSDDSSRLGGGGAGEVFRGVLRDEIVAVKTFHSTRTSSYLLDSGLGEGTGSSRDWSMSGSSCLRSRRSEGSSMRRANVMRGEPIEEDNVEDELEKTKVVRAFWDLRQEVAVLCHLRHPCVVRLLGVCLYPLCFLLELAPQGSLASVLEDATLGSDAVRDSVGPAKYEIKQCVLGRGLTYKMAYQVASALWYLHDSDIIYRDLKADNVLVWSLDETDLVNVKLSDYGISCFATPQGVAGDEGTPGYQAPEVRAGVGYDEKVDIFSYAMFLFELISGSRPFLDFRSAVDIKKAIRRNVRPSLEEREIDSQLPRLELLMRSCWAELPEKRPSAENILREMEEPSFLCQCRIMPAPEEGVLEKITAAYGLAHSGTGTPMISSSTREQSPGSSTTDPASTSSGFVLLWSRERTRRQYSMLNCDTGVFYTQDEPCPGHRVLCMVRVGSRTWLGTEGCTVEVFGRRSWRLPGTLCSFVVKAPVLALLTEEPGTTAATATPETRVSKVYASLANGTLVVFTHRRATTSHQTHDDVTKVYIDDTDVIKDEMDQWQDIQVVNLGQNRNPAKSMVLVKECKELWVGCGNKIIVMDTQTLVVVEEIPVYCSQRAHIRKMVTYGDRVWSIDRRSTKILQWDVTTHQLLYVFDCEINEPVGRVVCKAFSESAGQDIGEEEAKIRGATLERWPHEASLDTVIPPTYTEATVSSDRQTTERTLVGQALAGNVRSINRSGALKNRSSVGRPNNSSQDSNSDLSDTGVALSANEEVLDAQSQATQIRSDSVEIETSCFDDSGHVGNTPSVETLDSVECERPHAANEGTGAALAGTSVDSGFSADILPKLQPHESDKEPNGNSDVEIEEETRMEPRTEPAKDSKGTETSAELSAFEIVNRGEVIVEQSRERRGAQRAEYNREIASMASLRCKPKSLHHGPSLMKKSWKKKSVRRPAVVPEEVTSSKAQARRPRLHVMTGSINKVMTVLLLGGTLWVGRGRGDILVINVDPEAEGCEYGEVLAQLECDNYLNYANGQVDEIISTGNNKVVCLRRLETERLRQQSSEDKSPSAQSPTIEDPSTERFQLIIWEAWGLKEFQSFKAHLDEFNALAE